MCRADFISNFVIVNYTLVWINFDEGYVTPHPPALHGIHHLKYYNN